MTESNFFDYDIIRSIKYLVKDIKVNSIPLYNEIICSIWARKMKKTGQNPLDNLFGLNIYVKLSCSKSYSCNVRFDLEK